MVARAETRRPRHRAPRPLSLRRSTRVARRSPRRTHRRPGRPLRGTPSASCNLSTSSGVSSARDATVTAWECPTGGSGAHVQESGDGSGRERTVQEAPSIRMTVSGGWEFKDVRGGVTGQRPACQRDPRHWQRRVVVNVAGVVSGHPSIVHVGATGALPAIATPCRIFGRSADRSTAPKPPRT